MIWVRPRALTELIESSPAMVENCFSSGVATEAAMATTIEAGVGKKAPYFHASWINISWDMDEDELRARLANSYRLIVSGLPKKVQGELAQMPHLSP